MCFNFIKVFIWIDLLASYWSDTFLSHMKLQNYTIFANRISIICTFANQVKWNRIKLKWICKRIKRVKRLNETRNCKTFLYMCEKSLLSCVAGLFRICFFTNSMTVPGFSSRQFEKRSRNVSRHSWNCPIQPWYERNFSIVYTHIHTLLLIAHKIICFDFVSVPNRLITNKCVWFKQNFLFSTSFI